MEILAEIAKIIGFLGLILLITIIITFFIMAKRLLQILNEIRNIKEMLSKIPRIIYKCKHCGFESYTSFTFCPVCDRHRNSGITLEEIRQVYQEKERKDNIEINLKL